MVNHELSITAVISGAIFVAIFVATFPYFYSVESLQPSIEVDSPVTPEKTNTMETSVTQKENHIVKIFFDKEENIHVIHTLKESKNTRKFQVINGTLSNLSITGKDSNSIRYGTSGIEPITITIFPTEQQVLIEYDLDDVLLLKNGGWTWDFFYSFLTKFFFPENVALVFVNSNPVYVGDSGINCHGCDMILEYVVYEHVIMKDVEWGNLKFTVVIKTLAEMPYFVFDQPTKRIFLVVVSKNDPVMLIIPLDLLENPYDVYLNEEKILKHEFVINGTHASLHFRPETSGAIDIVGSKVVGEGPVMKTPEKILTISETLNVLIIEEFSEQFSIQSKPNQYNIRENIQ